MEKKSKALDLTIIGSGMIVRDLLLPAAYQLQREGVLNDISIVDMRKEALQELKDDSEIKNAFPGQTFTACPDINEDGVIDGDYYKQILAKKAPYGLVIVALPDHIHYTVINGALDYNQHILSVKPLVLSYEQSIEIEKKAYEKGCFIGVEYHKRFDRRSLLAKKHYQEGDLGEFVMGEAKMIEPYFYRHSNFQNWFTCENTDPFVYVGCHYVDLTYFITGLKPVEVSVSGVKGKFPNNNEGYMWTNGRVRFENGAILSVTDGLGYPDESAGSNDQCLNMYFEGDNKGGVLRHNDQFRGVEYGFTKNQEKPFQYVNPDFYRLVPFEEEGLKPVGYGFDSVAATLRTASKLEGEIESASNIDSMKVRRKCIEDVNERGLIATPKNSAINELVQEAARLSILSDGDVAVIEYGNNPHVYLRHKK
ncbi:MAG: Gfo/Idh/MocA family oxidoreductase [Verrucomicrobiota bacterium]|nr:Gfo/Idh/MocA family oxidoreductase [Verrucomicrobiota bacterium]